MAPLRSVVRSIGAVLGGAMVGVAIVAGKDLLLHRIHPPPEGTNLNDPETLREFVATLPLSAFLILLAGWVLAAAAGAYVAARIASRAPAAHGVAVALLMLVATVANLTMVPHPTWMWPAALLLIPAAGWLAAKGAAGPA